MGSVWYYFDEGQQRGPVTLEELVRAISGAPDPLHVPVWRGGLADWQSAGLVPEIRDRLPPPGAPRQPSGDAAKPLLYEDAEIIARLFRRLVILVGLQIAFGLIFQAFARGTPSSGAAFLLVLLNLGVLCLLVAIPLTTYNLMRHLREGWPVMWAFATAVPCVNIIVLLAISSRAQVWCRRYSLKVGLFGPTKQSIEELKRRVLGSTFD